MSRADRVVDWLRRTVPADSRIRPYAKWIVEDIRTLARTRRSWSNAVETPPDSLSIETINSCNANCIFCAYRYQSLSRSGHGVMSQDVFEKALCDFTELRGSSRGATVNFTPLLGEALLDPDIVGRIAHASSMGFKTTLFTNGIRLARMDIEALLESGLSEIAFSLAPMEEGLHESLYRSRGKYEDLRTGLERFMRLREEKGVPMKVHFLFRGPMPIKELVELADFRQHIAPFMTPQDTRRLYAQVAGFDSWGGQIGESDLLPGMHLAHPPRLKYRPCERTTWLHVLHDGSVRACSCRYGGTELEHGDPLLVGDIRSSSLLEIWQGERLSALRNRFVDGRLPDVCKECAMYRSV